MVKLEVVLDLYKMHYNLQSSIIIQADYSVIFSPSVALACNTYKWVQAILITLIRLFLHTVECNFYVFKYDSYTLTMCEKKILNHRKIIMFPVFILFNLISTYVIFRWNVIVLSWARTRSHPIGSPFGSHFITSACWNLI